MVDPNYDFLKDRNAKNREIYWDDVYAHELINPAPYDGLLVSMSAVRKKDGINSGRVKYAIKEEQRLLRDGIRKFLRLDTGYLKDRIIMGDCGAFAYVKNKEPLFSPLEVAEFYEDAGFTHGISPDHIIFRMDESNPAKGSLTTDEKYRYEISQNHAEEFLKLVRQKKYPFEPIGAVQGWSPKSISESAKNLESMGYEYLAIGGLVPLNARQIKVVLRSLKDVLKTTTKLHLLGFAKAEEIHEFQDFNIYSFDSSSPLIRAFKDSKSNYYSPKNGKGLIYYSAIRIPQPNENSKLLQGIKKGLYSPEILLEKEKLSLKLLREFDKKLSNKDDVIESVLDYLEYQLDGSSKDDQRKQRELKDTQVHLERTLTDCPWKTCECPICKQVGVEVIIFRGNNRNRRRGFHNLYVYKNYLNSLGIH